MRVLLIQVRVILWECKGQNYLTLLKTELASEVFVLLVWFPRQSDVGGKQHSNEDVRWYTHNLGRK